MNLPAVIINILFNYVPMYGIQLAFRKFSSKLGLTGGAFVGLQYFDKFVTSYQFKNLLVNTVRISLSTLVLGFPVPILLALLFNQLRSARYKRVMQTTVYMPHFISIVRHWWVSCGCFFFGRQRHFERFREKTFCSSRGNLMGRAGGLYADVRAVGNLGSTQAGKQHHLHRRAFLHSISPSTTQAK
jgi:hypothetical protein